MSCRRATRNGERADRRILVRYGLTHPESLVFFTVILIVFCRLIQDFSYPGARIDMKAGTSENMLDFTFRDWIVLVAITNIKSLTLSSVLVFL